MSISPVVLNPQLIGNWREALRQDDLVKSHLQVNGNIPRRGTTAYQQALTDFINAPATGVSSILSIARVKAGYNPLNPAQASNYSAFANWIKIVESSPILRQEYNNTVSIGGDNNWPAYLDQAINQYIGISLADVNRIRASIQNLINAAYSMPSTPETIQMVQNAIQSNVDGSVSVFFYYTSATIIYNKGGKHSSSKLGSYFNINRIKLNLIREKWQNLAEELMNENVELVSNWLNNMTARSSRIKINQLSCFESIPSLQNAVTVGNVNDYWNSFSWSDFPSDVQALWEVLGWNSSNWDGSSVNYPPSINASWEQLSQPERNAASKLGYNQVLWNSPSVSEAIRAPDIDAYWNKYDWQDMSEQLQYLWGQLGWNSSSWNGTTAKPASADMFWKSLSAGEQKSASLLGYISSTWDATSANSDSD